MERSDFMKGISTIRKTVAVMENKLHKFGYSLSQAFRRIEFLRIMQQSERSVLLHILV